MAAPGRQRTVTVVGKGAASAAPDTALLQLGVETRGATPAEAFDGCSRALDQVLAALDAEGVDPAARTTSGLDLQEDWDHSQLGQGPRGFRALAGLTARLADPARAGQVAAAAVAVAGQAARVNGLGFVVGDHAPVHAAAREAAWLDARARAGQYADLAGAALGEVLEIREAPPAPEEGRPMRSLAAEAAPAGPAVQPGQTTVWAAVAVTWTLQPPAPPAGG